MKKVLHVLDGYGLIYRAYFALIKRPLSDREGKNISALYGFFRTLFALYRLYDVKRTVVALDPIGKTFRHEFYPEYKATRDKAPEDLHAQVPLIEEILGLLDIPVFRLEGYEADDVMGTFAKQCHRKGYDCHLVSADKDLMQLVGEGVQLIRPQKGGGFLEMGPAEVFEDKGVHPHQIIDYLALIGDSSDNIPGVAGVGPKTASSLLAQWEDLDDIYTNIEKVSPISVRKKLLLGKEKAYFSQKLVRLRTDLPLDVSIDRLDGQKAQPQVVVELLREHSLDSLASTLMLLTKEGFITSSFQAEDKLPTGKKPQVRDSQEKTAQVLASPKAGKKNPTRYSAIMNEKDLETWGNHIQKAGILALDTETDSIDPMRASLVGLSFAVQKGEAAYLPLDGPEGPYLSKDLVFSWLKDLFADEKLRLVGQNFNYDRKVLAGAGLDVPVAWFDTMIAAWIIDSSSRVNMDSLADRYLEHRTLKFSDVVPKGATFAALPLQDALPYAAEDADITLQLYHVLAPKIETNKALHTLFRAVEMPLQPILAEMEMEGIGVDSVELEAYGQELEKDIDDLEREIHALCGQEFNIASPKQLQKILFEERGLTPIKKTKTGYSTDNMVLKELAKNDPVPEKILIYRSLSKLKSTYVDALPKLVHPQTGRLHTSYSQTGAATGRLSSNNPNLQNIPVRDENGRRIRRAFKSRLGHIFVSADYSQIELVVLAHMSGDQALREAFQTKVDVHARTASLLFGIDPSAVQSEQRRLAKAVNFGVMYGMSAFRLSNELKISRKEAKNFIERYFATYQGIKKFIDQAIREAEKEGGAHTLYGRFRPLPSITSSNRIEKAAAERAAVNSCIQGTAADIIKIAMIALDQALKKEKLHTKILLQVHDELLLEVPENEWPQIQILLKETMEKAVTLSIPLQVNIETGLTWGDIH